MKKRPGSIKIMTVHGIPMFVHWSFPIGGLLISVFTGFDPLKAFYYCIAYTSLVLIHELGHFTAARFLGLKVYALELAGLGGQCQTQTPRAARDIFFLFSAGLLAQAGVLLLTLLYLAMSGPPESVFGKCLAFTFTLVNIIVFITNILPFKPDGVSTDGEVLWNLGFHVFGGRPHPFEAFLTGSPVFSSETSLLSVADLRPAGFTVGIEILNDDTTPMEFVVSMLEKHLNMDRENAIKLMLDIHGKGGQLIPLPTLERAEEIAAAITLEARDQGHAFMCRAVDGRSQASADAHLL